MQGWHDAGSHQQGLTHTMQTQRTVAVRAQPAFQGLLQTAQMPWRLVCGSICFIAHTWWCISRQQAHREP